MLQKAAVTAAPSCSGCSTAPCADQNQLYLPRTRKLDNFVTGQRQLSAKRKGSNLLQQWVCTVWQCQLLSQHALKINLLWPAVEFEVKIYRQLHCSSRHTGIGFVRAERTPWKPGVTCMPLGPQNLFTTTTTTTSFLCILLRYHWQRVLRCY